MKNLKIFPKICIQTFSVIAIIVLFIHLFVYLIFPRTYLDVRKEEIYTKANEITENLSGKSEDYIEQALDFYSNTNEIKAFISRFFVSGIDNCFGCVALLDAIFLCRRFSRTQSSLFGCRAGRLLHH